MRKFKVVRSEMGKETTTEMTFTLLQIVNNMATTDNEVEMFAVMKVGDVHSIVSGVFSYAIERTK